jgi:hypothetical protein
MEGCDFSFLENKINFRYPILMYLKESILGRMCWGNKYFLTQRNAKGSAEVRGEERRKRGEERRERKLEVVDDAFYAIFEVEDVEVENES